MLRRLSLQDDGRVEKISKIEQGHRGRRGYAAPRDRGTERQISTSLLEFPAPAVPVFPLPAPAKPLWMLCPARIARVNKSNGVGQSYLLDLPHAPLALRPDVDEGQNGTAKANRKFQGQERKQPKHVRRQVAGRSSRTLNVITFPAR